MFNLPGPHNLRRCAQQGICDGTRRSEQIQSEARNISKLRRRLD